MAKSKFNLGDRVVCLYNIQNERGFEFQTANKLGTFRIQHKDGSYGIEFDDNIDGHSLVVKQVCYAKSKHGLWIKENCLVKAEEEDEIEYELSEELKEKLYEEFYTRVIIDLKEKGIIPKEVFPELIKEEDNNSKKKIEEN